MRISIFEDRQVLAQAAAERTIELIRKALTERKLARIVLETGEQHVDYLRELSAHRDVDWANVEVFCAGEYIGLPPDHPASVRRFLRDRLIAKTGIKKFFYFETESNLSVRIADFGAKLRTSPPDIAVLGIGENGRLALNSPPADFDTEASYFTIDLDFPYRSQQVSEGWFVDVGQVPMQAITMSVLQILRANEIIAVATGSSSALAVKVCAEHGISPTAPATILQTHSNANLYVDRESAAQLSAG